MKACDNGACDVSIPNWKSYCCEQCYNCHRKSEDPLYKVYTVHDHNCKYWKDKLNADPKIQLEEFRLIYTHVEEAEAHVNLASGIVAVKYLARNLKVG